MLKLFFHFAARLPLPVLHFAGALLGRMVYRISPSWRAHMTANLKQAGYHDPAIVAAASRESGKALTELPAVWLRAHADVAALVKSVDGWQHVEAAQSADAPIVFLTPHLGCFEITAQYYAFRTRADKPITVLYRRPRKAALTPLIESGRGRANMRLAAADLSGVRALIRALRQGEAAGLLPDQTPDLGEGVWAPFFGRPAYTMTLVKRLVRASGATVLLAFAERLPRGGGYRLTIRPFAGALAEDLVEATTQINAALEDLIRASPAQYLWSYDRYRQPRAVPRGGNGDTRTP